MRTIALFLLSLLFVFSVHATDVSIRTLNIDGKTAYVLDAGAFPNENNALQLKFKLSAMFKQPISIDYDKNTHLHIVKIGPLSDLTEAEAIRQRLKDEDGVTLRTPSSLPVRQPTAPEEAQTTNSEESYETDSEENYATNSEEIEPTETKQQQTIPVSGKKLWNLRNADIRAVIAEVSRVTRKNFVIDPRVQGKISIVSSSPMSDKELYQVFLSILQVSGFAAIPAGDIIKIIPNIDAKIITTEMGSQIRPPLRGDEMLVEVIPVRYVPADQLVPVLRPLMPQWSSVSAYAPSNMIILSGRASNIRQLARIIKEVDTSNANGIDMVLLKHALAMDVANTLKDLIKTQPGAGNHTQVMLAADDRSNAILVSGTRTDRIRMRILINKLDYQNPNGSNSNTQVVYLNYLRAEDLVPILAGIAQANFSGNVGTTIGTITRPELDSTNPASNLVNSSSGSNSSSGNPSSYAAPVAAVNSTATPNTTGATTQN